jgi:LPXTG-motif cell wall-anchored protein
MYFSKIIKVVLLLSLLALVVPSAVAYGETAGTVTVRDSSPTLSDQVVIDLAGLPALGEGETYEAWLYTDDSSGKLSLGVLEVDDGSVNQTYTHPDGGNLGATYDKFYLTIEPSGQVAASDRIPSKGLVRIRKTLLSTADLWEQTNVALSHAILSTDSANTLADIKKHAEHVVNAVEGSGGSNYGDLDGNGSVEDFGDGSGVVNHAANTKANATDSSHGVPGDSTLDTFAPEVSASSDNAASWAEQARDQALKALDANSVLVAQAYMANAQTLLGRALNGYDTDRDGSVALGGTEGGALQAQQGSQNLARYDIGSASLPATGGINYGLFAVLAVVVGALMISSGGFLFSRKRAQS